MELYSIVASLIRESKNKCKLSIRDVTSRRKTKISKKYYGESGFPDFIVLDQKFEKFIFNASICGLSLYFRNIF